MGFRFLLLLFFTPSSLTSAWLTHLTALVVNGSEKVAETDSNFVCATIDWWPHDKCNYGKCPWGNSSVINLDLSHPFLVKAIKAFNQLRIRIGGSLQDQVFYNAGNLKLPCHPFKKMDDGLFGFSKGCLRMNRWDELNGLFHETGAVVTFGLNALNGRHKVTRNKWGGDWDSSNAHNFIKYTVSKGYVIDSWEFGNELCGEGVSASVSAAQYGKDSIKLKAMINELYRESHLHSSLLAPGGFYDREWFEEFLQVSGPNVVNAVTHHIYNLGPGSDPHLISKILNPDYLDKISSTFKSLDQTIRSHGPWASAWVGESGGAYNSGGHLVSDTFVNSFWYLDQLGMASKYNTKVYCRQTLIGGNYGLLNSTTYAPNPDYYSALLWHRLMGRGVLSIDSNATPHLRSYAHCSKIKGGVTVLLINLSNETEFSVRVHNAMNIRLDASRPSSRRSSFMNRLRRAVSWVGRKASDRPLYREEYHLTPEGGKLRSQSVLLNGSPLKLDRGGDVPALDPVHQLLSSPISVAPLSIAFAVFPNFDAPACA